MTGRDARTAPPLIIVVARRILGFAALAITLQMGIVFFDYWFDDGELGRLLIENETAVIAEEYRHPRGATDAFPSAALQERYGLSGATNPRAGYFYRIRLDDGRVLAGNCPDDCTDHFLPLTVHPPAFWDRPIRPGKPLTVAGGRTFDFGDSAPLVVEFASLGDPRRLVNGVIFHEMVDHMIVPMGLMLFVVIGATILSIRKTLVPVAMAARAADRLDPRLPLRQLSTEGMPAEVADLTRAVNRAFGRVAELVRSQKLFSAAIAHEIRTPVAIVKLELARIQDPRARKAERDLDRLTHTLEQLTALARLDAVEGEAFRTASLSRIARDAVAELAPLVFASGRTIALRDETDATVLVVPSLIQTLLRNLVENAVKHTRTGTTITVAVEAPGSLVVSDDGDGFAVAQGRVGTELGVVNTAGSLGIGLKIAERIAALHGALLVVDSAPGQGTTVRLVMEPVSAEGTTADSVRPESSENRDSQVADVGP
jgi:signal transduction histidine kinase